MAGPFEPQVAPYVPPNPANAIAGAFLQYYQQNRQQQLDALNKQVLTAKLGELAQQHVTTEAEQYNQGVRSGTAPATPTMNLPVAGTVSGQLPGAFLPTSQPASPVQAPSDQRAGGIFGARGLSTPVTGPAYTQIDPTHYIDPNATPFAHQMQLTDTRNQTTLDRLQLQNQMLLDREIAREQADATRQAQGREDAQQKRIEMEDHRQHNRIVLKETPSPVRPGVGPRAATDPDVANTQKALSAIHGQLVDARAQQKAAQTAYENLYKINATGADSAAARAAIDSAGSRLGILRQQAASYNRRLQDLLTATPDFSDVSGGSSSFGARHSANPAVQAGRPPATPAVGAQSLKAASSPRGSSESSAAGAPHQSGAPTPTERAPLSARDKAQAARDPGFAAFLKQKGYGPGDWQ